MRAEKKRKYIEIAAAVLLNIVAVYFVSASVVSSVSQFKQLSFTQNVENIKTLTDASANEIELVIDHYTKEVSETAAFISHYQEIGMTEAQIQMYFREYYGEGNQNWQLISNNVKSQGLPLEERFEGEQLTNAENTRVSYRVQFYPDLAVVFRGASEEELLKISYLNEYTDVVTQKKSFAIGCYVRVQNEEKGYQYDTLLRVVESEEINKMIDANNSVENMNFPNYTNVIINQNGDYVFSTEWFQGKNILRYIETYDDSLTKAKKDELVEKLKNHTAEDPIYYKNNKGKDCIYTISQIQNTQWYVLSVVPIESFHNIDHNSESYIRFLFSFLFLFLVDISIILTINWKLRRKTKEAKEASIAKSRFLSSMSHDIRTPMNGIIGMTAIAKNYLKETNLNREALEDCVKTIELSGNHLLTLINDILDISKIESGKVALKEEDFSLSNRVEKMIEIVQMQILEKELQVDVHMEGLKHTFVHADELRISQIMMNIFSNALKYTNQGGEIRIDLWEEPSDVGDDRMRYRYRVTDNGIGMSEEFQRTIFERFTREVDSRINSVQGSGLGMSIVKQLVDLMGGTIDVKSELNVGSVFTVTLDLLVAEIQMARQDETLDVERGQYQELRVLVAEDNQINWKIINKLLNTYDIQADRAENGRQALEQIQQSECYDLILMDIQMPVMNGYEATERIRKLKDPKKAAIPIYAMTADTFAEDVAHCMEKGMNGHLAKPLEVEKLLEVLGKISGEKTR